MQIFEAEFDAVAPVNAVQCILNHPRAVGGIGVDPHIHVGVSITDHIFRGRVRIERNTLELDRRLVSRAQGSRSAVKPEEPERAPAGASDL